jgi:hypothetical protein
LHVDDPLHALAPPHKVPTGCKGLEQTPVAGAQVPTPWHWSCAVHLTAVPAWQVPDALHVSAPLHAFPSLHDAPDAFSGFEQTPVAGAQVPAVWHESNAVHITPIPAWHVPDALHVSAPLHAFPSLHEAPAAFFASAGQLVWVPLHVSATSHAPTAIRHTVPAFPALCWQLTLVPLHKSVVHAFPSSAQVVGATAEQVPTLPVRLHEPQPPLQAVSQQTPLTQKPVAHWLFVVQVRADDGS